VLAVRGLAHAELVRDELRAHPVPAPGHRRSGREMRLGAAQPLRISSRLSLTGAFTSSA